VLKVEDIHTYYGDSYILQGISLEVGQGQVLGILGRNAMGKTTLLRSIIGFTPPRQGKIIFQDEDLTRTPTYEIVRKGISIVPQGREIFPSLSVKENLIVGFKEKQDGWTLDKIYELFPLLKDRARHPGNRLSGGEQQMLAIGRSLMTNPSLLLMDEPTEGLSPIYVEIVGQVILKLQQSGMSILLVEQNLRFAQKYTGYIHILSRGQIVHSSAPGDLDDRQDITQKYLGV
jgi:branched-chain amino acid transport system ATP-binding protein